MDGIGVTTSTTPGPERAATPSILTTRAPSPAAAIGRAAVTVLLVVLLFRFLLRNVSWSDVWDSLSGVSGFVVVGLWLLMAANQALKARIPATIIPELGVARSFVAEETSGVMSKVLPGPSGTAARYAIYRSFGIGPEAFGTCTVVNSLMNNGFVLVMPALAVVPLLADHDVPRGLLVVAGISVTISLVGAALVVVVARSETLAYRLGATAGRLLTWFRGLRHRPAPDDVGAAVVHFRDTSLQTVARSWRRLVPLMLAKYAITALLLCLSLRAVGLGPGSLTYFEVFAVQVFAGVLTMVEVTPGGLGVTETVYIKLFQVAMGTHDERIVAGVLLYRAITYLGPMLLGAGSYVVWRRRSDWRAGGVGTSGNLLAAGFEDR